MLYVSPDQINAILPSAVQEGLQIVYVDVNGVQSGPGSIQVLTSRFAAFTHSQLGFGPAMLQQYNNSGVSLNGLMHPAAPGQALVLWGTGLGPLPSGSDAEAPGVVNLGNNFYLPSTVPAGCYVPITVSVSGEARFEVFIRGDVQFSTPPTLSVGSSNSPCASEFGLSAALVERLDQGGTSGRTQFRFRDWWTASGDFQWASRPVARAWLSDYDASNLSLLASGWRAPHSTLSFCERQAYITTVLLVHKSALPPRSLAWTSTARWPTMRH
ncbi:MAG: hypothetical protein DMG57_16010 [Acidobacteria bacterium]|nr:MAG: hypothetical protein DMG57_16010 [Acidobacteriota bacterium]